MHTLTFLEPGHFHATLTLREPHPGVSLDVFVYTRDEAGVRDFLVLVERFNARGERPTRWRPVVIVDPDPLSRLCAERRGDAVVLAGRNGGKARTFRRLREAGFHVLADKPWLVEPEDLDDIAASLAGWPLVMEIMTGRHDLAARTFKRLCDNREVLGELRAVETESVHHLEKRVDGAPLRRPPWFFDVRVQGGGAVDIPTHVVDQAQWLLESRGVAPDEKPRLTSACAWDTRVPLEAFRRITGETEFSRELNPFVDGATLRYACNAALEYRLGGVIAKATVSWDLSTPPGGDDTHATVVRGTRADALMERAAHTGYRRRLTVRPRDDSAGVRAAIDRMPGVTVVPAGDGACEVVIAPGIDAGHESYFSRVLAQFLKLIDGGAWPSALAERTLAKYALLAEAAARIRTNEEASR